MQSLGGKSVPKQAGVETTPLPLLLESSKGTLKLTDVGATSPLRVPAPTPASGIRHLASGIRHLASGIWHPASGIRHLRHLGVRLSAGQHHAANGP
jgi:hypothetical protein